MDVTVSGSTVKVTVGWRRDSYGYSSFSGAAKWKIVIDGTTWTGTWNFSGPAGGSISRKNLATKSKNVGYQGSTNVQIQVDFDVSPGVSNISRSVTVAARPGKVPSVAYDSLKDTSVRVKWGAAASNGSSIDLYHVHVSKTSDFASYIMTETNGSGRSSTVSGLSRGTKYYARVIARNGVGWNTSSTTHTILQFTTSDRPNAPTTPSLSFTAPTTLKASWSAPNGNGGAIDSYQLQFADNSSFSSAQTISTSSRSSTKTDATRGKTWYARVRAHNTYGWGPYSGTRQYSVPDRPSGPATPTVSGVTTTGALVSWSAPSNGGASLTGYDVQWNASQSETGATTQSQGTTTSKLLSGLTPGMGYFVRVRAKNSQGNSSWSAWRSFTTLPAVAPGMSVVAAASGRSATVLLSPPGGVTGVSSYSIERRIGTGAATSFSTTSTTYVSNGLTPGTTYQWRASAFIGSYQSPWTGWVSVTQPRPNTNPGDYFDGSTADGADVSYAWTGAANASTSTATAQGVLGWKSSISGATLTRVTGGLFGDYAAVFQSTTDVTNVRLLETDAQFAAAVAEGAPYVGSVWVQANEPIELAAQIQWLDASHAPVSFDAGAGVSLTPDDGWVRLLVSQECPAGAAFASVAIVATLAMQAGSSFLIDGGMVSLGVTVDYFDGDSTDTADSDYQWLGTRNNSVSVAFPLTTATVDPLADPDCVTPPSAPLPPSIENPCVDEVGMWRRYFAVIPADQVPSWAVSLPTVTLSTNGAPERQIRVRVYPNPDNLPVDQLDVSSWDSEAIVSYLPANTSLVLDSVSRRAWAILQDGSRVAADRLLYGTGNTPPSWPELRCGFGYVLSFDTPLEAPSGNLGMEISLTDRVM